MRKCITVKIGCFKSYNQSLNWRIFIHSKMLSHQIKNIIRKKMMAIISCRLQWTKQNLRRNYTVLTKTNLYRATKILIIMTTTHKNTFHLSSPNSNQGGLSLRILMRAKMKRTIEIVWEILRVLITLISIVRPKESIIFCHHSEEIVTLKSATSHRLRSIMKGLRKRWTTGYL